MLKLQLLKLGIFHAESTVYNINKSEAVTSMHYTNIATEALGTNRS